MVKAALIDFDGTLADSMPYWLDLPRESLRRAGIPEPAGFEERIRALPMREIAPRLEAEYPALLENGPLLAQWYAAMEEHYRRHIPLKPGASELLAGLRSAGLRLVILSATRRELLAAAMEAHALWERVDMVLSEEQTGSKHSRDAYDCCARLLGLTLSELLLIEDAPANLAAAASLGVTTVGVYDPSMAAWQDDIRKTVDVYLPGLTDWPRIVSFLRDRESLTEQHNYATIVQK